MNYRKALDKALARITRKKNAIKRLIYKLCLKYIKAYENVNYDYVKNGETFFIEQLKHFSPSTIFDVGANRGEWTIIANQILPSADIHVFEAVPETYHLLTKQINNTGKLHLNNLGLSNESGFSEIFTDASKDTHATMITKEVGRENFQTKKIQTKKGDEYCHENNINQIDFLKIDVEGAEHLVLRGFSEMLNNGSIAAIQFEYTALNIYSRFLLKDFYDYLKDKGYYIGKLFPNGVAFKDYTHSDEDFKGPNYIAVHKSNSCLIEKLRIKHY